MKAFNQKLKKKRFSAKKNVFKGSKKPNKKQKRRTKSSSEVEMNENEVVAADSTSNEKTENETDRIGLRLRRKRSISFSNPVEPKQAERKSNRTTARQTKSRIKSMSK